MLGACIPPSDTNHAAIVDATLVPRMQPPLLVDCLGIFLLDFLNVRGPEIGVRHISRHDVPSQ